MKVMITGSSGFIGTSLVEYLTKETDHEVVGMDILPPKEDFDITTYPADIRSYPAVVTTFKWAEPDVVVHLAAQPRVEPSYFDPIETYRINVQGTLNLLEASRSYGLGRFIYVSSEIIYGEADHYPTREVDHFRPDSAYASSKVAGDVLTQNCHGLRTLVLRSGMGYGPRSPPEQVITKFMLKAMDDKPLFFPKPKPGETIIHPTRDVNYVGDFVKGMSQAIASDKMGVYNMGSGREYSVLHLARKIIKVVGSGRIEFSEKFNYRPGEEGKRTWLDISRAREDLGYDPSTSLEEGLNVTYEWLKENRDYWR